MSTITINATRRDDQGKGASRRLRHQDKTPAIIYGSGEPVAITVEHRHLWKAQENEAFYSSVLTLSVDGKKEEVILKALQRHPAKNLIMHADFQRADESVTIKVNVPLHFEHADSCPGVKMQGGIAQYINTSIRVACSPSKLPEFIEVNMAAMSIGDILHISDLTLPEGVESIDLALGEDHDLALVQIQAVRGSTDDEVTDSDAEADDDGESDANEG